MNKLSILVIACLLAFSVSPSAFAATDTEAATLQKARGLISDKKYESAYELLEKADPGYDKPEIVLLKEEIALDYFVTSLMHQMFALKDLKKNEDVMDYRGKSGLYTTHMFKIDEVLTGLIKKYPDNYKLYNGLGYYYFEAYSKYGGNWLKSDEELQQLIETNYTKAVDHNAGDATSYYALGHINLERKNYKKAISYLLKGAALGSDNANLYYDLSYGYLYTNDMNNALKYAKISLNMYKDKTYKGDAARMAAISYSELGDEKHAKEYYELSDRIDPGNYYTLKPLLALDVKSNDPRVQAHLNAFFGTAPENPTIYNDLAEIYFSNNRTEELIAFYISKLPKYQTNKAISGNLNFYLGQLYMERDKKKAKEHFAKAKEIFATVYAKDHQVFGEIDAALKKLN